MKTARWILMVGMGIMISHSLHSQTSVTTSSFSGDWYYAGIKNQDTILLVKNLSAVPSPDYTKWTFCESGTVDITKYKPHDHKAMIVIKEAATVEPVWHYDKETGLLHIKKAKE